MTDQEIYKIIHIAKISDSQKKMAYLLLRQKAPHEFVWYTEDNIPSEVKGATIQSAIQNAYKYWKLSNISMVNCGFRYTLPERDEHGNNALYCQMALSYSSPLGIYYDEELGHNCIVNFASDEAKDLLKRLK